LSPLAGSSGPGLHFDADQNKQTILVIVLVMTKVITFAIVARKKHLTRDFT